MSIIEKVSCFPNEGSPEVIPGVPQAGDLVRIATASGAVIFERYTPPASPPALKPLTLTITAFRKYAASRLAGGGLNGMARFEEIIAQADAATGAVKFCHGQYMRAETFEKPEVATFAAILTQAEVMSPEEADSILNNWPTS